MVVLATVFVVVSIILSVNVGPARYNRAKYDTYECGIDPTPAAAGGGRFPVKYYITAMMFLVFDVEVAFLYPWAVTFDALGVFGFAAMMIFLIVLGVASAANAAVGHVRDWVLGSDDWVTMGVPSDGSYGIPKGIVFGFPCECKNGTYKIVQGIEIDAYSQEKINKTLKELTDEADAVKDML